MDNLFRAIGSLTLSDLLKKSSDGVSAVIANNSFFTRNPESNPGTRQILFSGTTANLTGSGTAYDGATIVSYLWEVVQGGATITSPNSASTGVTGLTAGNNAFRLTVTDSNGKTGSSAVSVFVSASSARWNFTKTAFAVSGNNNLIAGATVVGNLSQKDSATDWVILTNGGEWETYLGSFQALNNGEGGSSAGSPTYTTFSADELQGGFLQAGHSTENGGKYPVELHGLPAGTYKLYLIASIKASVNANVPNGVMKVKFGSAAATTQTIAQQSNYTTPALVFEGTIAEGEIIEFGPYTLTEGNGDATVFNALLIEKVAAQNVTGTANGSATASANSATQENLAGSAAGLATATGAQQTIVSAAGSAAGTATAAGAAYELKPAAGASAGTATAQAAPQIIQAAAGTAAGAATASATGQTTAITAGLANGSATAAAQGQILAVTSAQANGAATAGASATLVSLTAGQAAGSGTATASGSGTGQFNVTGAAQGQATAQTNAQVIVAASGQANGLSASQGQAFTQAEAAGQSQASSFGQGTSQLVALASGQADGTSTATAVLAQFAFTTAAANGGSTAQAFAEAAEFAQQVLTGRSKVAGIVKGTGLVTSEITLNSKINESSL